MVSSVAGDVAADHTTLVERLKDPGFYPYPVESVSYLQTHISSIFLTGSHVYKLKKPVNFGFLDFTTPELRRQFCEAELELNRRLAPSVYEKVLPITRDGDRLALDGAGEPVDWVVVMHQLDGERLGPKLVESGELGQAHIDAVVDLLVPFYRMAATGGAVDEYGKPEVFKVNTDENFAQTEGFVGEVLSQEQLEAIRSYTDRFYEVNRGLFQRRIEAGRIRECHGDLHLGNIFFVEPPVIFDCIEFNERFRSSDVAADLGFLAMDLDFRGRPELSQRLIERYVELSGDEDLPAIVRFYQCYRAYVRGKIACFTFSDPNLPEDAREVQKDLARRYFELASRYATERRPVLAVVFGLMGTGKTSLARHLSSALGWQSLNSDVVRKQLAGIEETTRVYVPYNQGMYSPEMNHRTFTEMYRRAEEHLRGGSCVVLDGSFKTEGERERALRTARRCGADLVLLQTSCEPKEQYRRLEKRELTNGDVSDGRSELVEAQRRDFEPVDNGMQELLEVVKTDGPKEETQAGVRMRLMARGLIASP